MAGRTRIKICGIKDVETALAAIEAGADAVGLVFAPGSPRFISADQGWQICAYMPPFAATVGLFVNPTHEHITAVRESCPFDYIQLHGGENEELIRACGPGVIKAIRFDPTTIAAAFERWNAVSEIGALIVDGSLGGEGVTLDWHALAASADRSDHPIILAGGLTPANVGDAIRAVRPYGVDVSSGVESSKGAKDIGLIAEFCAAVRDADDSIEGP